MRPDQKSYRCLLALLILAGAFVRLHITFDRPLWDDELWQRFVTREGGYLDFLRWRHDEPVHAPLSFLLNHLCADIFKSDAAWCWRLPSLVAGILCIPAGFRVGKNLGSSALGLGIAAMLAFDLNTVWESANARMYSMLALGILVAIAIALPLLNSREILPRRAIALGFVLAALIWTHLLAVLPWCAIGLAGVLLMFRRDASTGRRALLLNLSIAFGIACLLGSPGIWRFFAIRDGVGAAIPDRSSGEVLHLFYWLVNLLVWIQVRFISPLVLTLSLIGAISMFRRFRAMSLLLLALGLMTGLSQIHLLHTHPFSVMRYFIPAQPILWIGLPFLLLIAPPTRFRPIAAGIFCVLIGVQAWNCTRLESTYGTVVSDVRESHAFVTATDFVKANKTPTDAVTYWPYDRFAYRGEYFGVPANEALGGPARPAPPVIPIATPDPKPFDGPAVWLVARIKGDSLDDSLKAVLTNLGARYNSILDTQAFNQQLAASEWLVARVARDGFTFHAFPLK